MSAVCASFLCRKCVSWHLAGRIKVSELGSWNCGFAIFTCYLNYVVGKRGSFGASGGDCSDNFFFFFGLTEDCSERGSGTWSRERERQSDRVDRYVAPRNLLMSIPSGERRFRSVR